MDTRRALLDAAARHGLDAGARGRLLSAAALDAPPPDLTRRLARGLGALSAALIGLSLVFGVAAQWASLDRRVQFALLQAAVALPALGAWALRGPARAPLALLAFVACGALFAYIGQTYQTGADPWQLFALWALLTLPLALALRHDLIWAPWALVVMTAAALWMQTHTAHRWRFEPQDLRPQLLTWAVCLAVVAGLSGLCRRATGAGVWSLRTAVVAAAFVVSATALGGLLRTSVGLQYPLGLLVAAVALVLLASRRAFDLFSVSAWVLAVDGLLVAGLARLLFQGGGRGDPMGRLLVVGLAAAGLLAFSVSQVLRLARRRRGEPSP